MLPRTRIKGSSYWRMKSENTEGSRLCRVFSFHRYPMVSPALFSSPLKINIKPIL